jgi:hypothetical protein
MAGAAKRVRGAVWTSDPATIARHTAELPHLWEAIQALVETVDEQYPPYGSLGQGSDVRGA